MRASRSPLDIYHSRIDAGEIQPDPGQRAAIEHLAALHGALHPPRPARGLKRLLGMRRPAVRGLYLFGGVGTGKTMLMDTFVHAQPPGTAERVHFHRFMQSVHERRQAMGQHRDPLRVIAGETAGRIRVLCLDEFSVTDITDAMILSGLLHALFERGVVLVTTSNTRIGDLYRDGLQRARFEPAIELLRSRLREVEVDSGTDYRMAVLGHGGAFHVGTGEAAHRRLADSFTRLADRHEVRAVTLDVCGRPVPAVAAAAGVAWFTFETLCAQARSRSDYLEIAREFHTVLLSGIPALDAARDDAARRLVELVDVLYDRNVNLVVSADRGPAELYTGRRLAEMFARTASRLTEMGADAYLARPHLA